MNQCVGRSYLIAILVWLLAFPHFAGGEAWDSDVRAEEARWMREALQPLRFGLPDQFLATLQAAYDSGDLPGWLMEFDKNLLDSTERDGILFTHGSLDTLGAWIWQSVLAHRRDVTVIPLGLLNEPWYVLQLKENRRLHPSGAPITWNRTDILNRTMPLWDGRSLVLGQGVNAQELKVQDPEGSLCSGRIYTRETMTALAQILESNGWDRPVSFSPHVKKELIDALSSWLCRKGLSYTLCASGSRFDWEATWRWTQSATFDEVVLSRSLESDSVSFYCARLHQMLADALECQGRHEDASWAQRRAQVLLNGRLLAPSR